MKLGTREVVTTCVGATLLVAGIAIAQEASVRPVATVRQIMEGLVVPSSDAVFMVTDMPKTDEEWAAAERQAAVLAEAGNLLLLGTRAKDKGAWTKGAQALITAGANAATAAKGRKFDTFLEASDAIAETCVNCHEKYLGK